MKYGPFISLAAMLEAMKRNKADWSAIPSPANEVPSSERIDPSAGTNTEYARSDHQHPRLTSTTYATLDEFGEASVTFSRTFANKPGINLTETDADTGDNPLVLRVTGWMQSGGSYTGASIQGLRMQDLPALSPVSGLLAAVITGVNAIVTALSGYPVFAAASAGATVSVIAVARSDVEED